MTQASLPASPAALDAVPALDALDTHLAETERNIGNLIPGTEKSIRWAAQPGTPTPTALVYLHGFSASRQDTAPLLEEVAQGLGANLFCTRLSGHGRDGQALAEARLADWQRDTLEALAIGQRLGRQVVLVGASTGASLAIWAATRAEANNLTALILLSPNLGPNHPLAELMLWPWGHRILRLVVGPEHSYTPRSPDHARYFTWSYPSEALLTMMAAVKLARTSPAELIDRPTLVVYAPDDRVVSARKIRRFFPRIGSKDKRLIALENTNDRQHHALAGRILAPADTTRVRDLISAFLQPRLTTPGSQPG